MLEVLNNYIDGENLIVGDMLHSKNYLVKTHTYGVHDICLINLYDNTYQFFFQNLKPDFKYADEFLHKVSSDTDLTNVYQQYKADLNVVESIAINSNAFHYFINHILGERCEDISILSLVDLYNYSLEILDYIDSNFRSDYPKELQGVITINWELKDNRLSSYLTR